MKLAEALIQRADAQTKLTQLKTRMQNNIKVQEGELPAEDFAELLSWDNTLTDEFTTLAKRTNKTNATTPM
ncbi:MAG: DIP1984 family protein [Deltaproteobacteria bacterium]|nr:DIP1984 family protein [Deltaproteobacteria bacterium]